jgi:hypothetical protein
MSGRHVLAVLLVFATLLVTSSCGDKEATGDPVGARILAAVRADLSDRVGIRVQAVAPGSGVPMTSYADGDLRSGDFRVRIDLGSGRGTVEMIRVADLCWTRAAPRFWTELGYTAASAARTRGKFVVAPVTGFAGMIAAVDPIAAITRIEQLRGDAVLSHRIVGSGPLHGQIALRVRFPEGVLTLFVTAGDRPHLTRVRGTAARGRIRDYVVLGYPVVSVAIPAAADVLQP